MLLLHQIEKVCKASICLKDISHLFPHHNFNFAFELRRSLNAFLIYQRYTSIVDIVSIVPIMRKSPKAGSIKINRQRVVRSYEDIDSHIKFFMPYQKRIVDIPLNNIGLRLITII